LDRKIERNEYRLALIDLEEAQRRYDESIDNVKLEVRQAYRDLQEAAERYQIQKSSLQLAEKRVESTTLLLDAGRATTRDLLESQDALLEAQDAVAGALVAHLGAKLNFFKDVGILQVRPDGMWVQ
jgi:outer membrane protein TolC